MSLTIISRDGWGATNPKRPFTKLSKWRVKGIVLHHSGVRNGPSGIKAVKAFERHHIFHNGWNVLGIVALNLFVTRVGVVTLSLRQRNVP